MAPDTTEQADQSAVPNGPALRVVVVTLFPAMLDALRAGGVTARAIERGLVSLEAVNPRDHAQDRHRTTDDRPYGGGPGMVMCYAPLVAAIDEAPSATNAEAITSAATTGVAPMWSIASHSSA